MRTKQVLSIFVLTVLPLLVLAAALALHTRVPAWQMHWGLLAVSLGAMILFVVVLPPLGIQYRPDSPPIAFTGITAVYDAAIYFGGLPLISVPLLQVVFIRVAAHFAWGRMGQSPGVLGRIAAFLRANHRTANVRNVTVAKSANVVGSNAMVLLIAFPAAYFISHAIPLPIEPFPSFATVVRLYVFGFVENWTSGLLVLLRLFWRGRMGRFDWRIVWDALSLPSWGLALFPLALLYKYVGILGFLVAILTAVQLQTLLGRAIEAGRRAQAATLEAEQAYYDGLTGVQNRRGLEREFGRGHTRYTHLSICDIDHFKRFNDTYGHQLGDDVLRRFARVISAAFEGVYVGRYGGEEFVLMLRADTDAAAAEILNQIRSAVENDRHVADPKSGEMLSITASFGLTRIREGDGFEASVKRADDCLYAAKEGGRNRVVLAA